VSPRKHFGFIIASSVFPLLGMVAAIILLWNHAVETSDLIVFGVMYAIAGIGVSTGYHRLLAHRSFKTYRPMRILLTAAGAMAGQGPPLIWTAHHRHHHRLADKPGDPHSPYLDDKPGFLTAVRGLWHAHLGWLFNRDLSAEPLRYCPDLVRDKDMRFISRYFIRFVFGGIILAGMLGFILSGTWQGLVTGALWGGLVRFFVTNHVTYSVNSVGHYFGRRRFDTPDESRNVAWLALLSFGESWHNNHHAFPRSARHGLRWWELDVSALVIRCMEAVGLAWDVVRIDQERQEHRSEVLSRVGGGRMVKSTPPPPLAERREVAVGVADVE
jgi:stearoyl-CoA desaturase (Delta-9 desaturase)